MYYRVTATITDETIACPRCGQRAKVTRYAARIRAECECGAIAEVQERQAIKVRQFVPQISREEFAERERKRQETERLEQLKSERLHEKLACGLSKEIGNSCSGGRLA